MLCLNRHQLCSQKNINFLNLTETEYSSRPDSEKIFKKCSLILIWFVFIILLNLDLNTSKVAYDLLVRKIKRHEIDVLNYFWLGNERNKIKPSQQFLQLIHVCGHFPTKWGISYRKTNRLKT